MILASPFVTRMFNAAVISQAYRIKTYLNDMTPFYKTSSESGCDDINSFPISQDSTQKMLVPDTTPSFLSLVDYEESPSHIQVVVKKYIDIDFEQGYEKSIVLLAGLRYQRRSRCCRAPARNPRLPCDIEDLV